MTLTRYIAGRLIYESDLDPYEKIKLLIKISKLREDKDIIKLVAHNSKLIQELNIPMKHIAPTAALAGGAYMGYKGIRAIIDPCQQACGTFMPDSPKRQACVKRCMIDKLQLKLRELEDKDCSQSKLKKRCELVKEAQIREISNKIQELSKEL